MIMFKQAIFIHASTFLKLRQVYLLDTFVEIIYITLNVHLGLFYQKKY